MSSGDADIISYVYFRVEAINFRVDEASGNG